MSGAIQISDRGAFWLLQARTLTFTAFFFGSIIRSQDRDRNCSNSLLNFSQDVLAFTDFSGIISLIIDFQTIERPAANHICAAASVSHHHIATDRPSWGHDPCPGGVPGGIHGHTVESCRESPGKGASKPAVATSDHFRSNRAADPCR
jgi:hypothetical protein